MMTKTPPDGPLVCSAIPRRLNVPVRQSTDPPISGHILLVEGHDLVRSVVDDMLQKLGYRTVSASDGKSAIEQFKTAGASENPFDIVIMDLASHGGMGVEHLIRALKTIDPGVQAILSSTCWHVQGVSEHRAAGFCGVLVKPFRLQHLESTLQRVLA